MNMSRTTFPSLFCKYSNMPFFTRKRKGDFPNKTGDKRKKSAVTSKFTKKSKKETKNKADEIISSDEDLSDHGGGKEENYTSEEETYQEKKIRLTKKYLKELEEEEKSKAPDLDDTKEAVSHRLKEIALEELGRLQKKVAKDYEKTVVEELFVLKGHNRSITCLTVSNSEKFLFTASKDSCIIKWCLETGKKLKTVPRVKKGADESTPGHALDILSIAISSDDKFLATGCKGKLVNVWNPDTMELLKTFRGHKNAIYGLAFNKGSHQLISASSDRALKLWNLDEMGYVETLFGHQDAIMSIDSFHGETAITAGGRDNTIRIWKIVEESQLVYQGHGASIDFVCVSSPQQFVSGADDGSLSLWGLNKKKPLFKVLQVHGCDAESENPHWITSLCSMPNTDLIASGSHDGKIRLWRRDDEKHMLQAVSEIPAKGFVNSMCFTPSGKFLVAGLGQEHKLGRWWCVKEAKNVVTVYKFGLPGR